MFKTIKKACCYYTQLSNNTRLIIKIMIISVVSLCLCYIYCENAVNNQYYYEFLKISDEIITCAKSITGVGFLGIITVGIAERDANDK